MFQFQFIPFNGFKCSRQKKYSRKFENDSDQKTSENSKIIISKIETNQSESTTNNFRNDNQSKTANTSERNFSIRALSIVRIYIFESFVSAGIKSSFLERETNQAEELKKNFFLLYSGARS